jgi:hypothetical protein
MEDYTSNFYNGTYGNSEPTTNTSIPTDPYGPDVKTVGKYNPDITDTTGKSYLDDKKTSGGVSKVIDIGNTTQVNAVERIGQIRYGNPGNVRIEIRYGKDNTLFELERIYVDYIKAPQHIRLSQEQLDLTEDTSQMMEFPDYVCQEIINELVHIVMENGRDDRLNTHIPVTQTVANPTQQQEQPQPTKRGN